MTHNRYPGINPHLNSYLQHVKGWKGFHAAHLAHLSEAIEAALPPGYTTKLEDSLQFSARHEREHTEPDEPIIPQPDLPAAAKTPRVALNTPTLVLPVFENEEVMPAVVIYRADQPVTRLELLAPASKFPGFHHDPYLKKREALLLAGMRLVEIDYLHERRPIIDRMPAYLHQDKGAYPYYIAVSDPRQSLGLSVYGFGILDKLPALPIPLDGADTIEIEFNPIYQHTFDSRAEFYAIRTDDTQPPANFNTYSVADQELIRRHMAAITRKTGEHPSSPG